MNARLALSALALAGLVLGAARSGMGGSPADGVVPAVRHTAGTARHLELRQSVPAADSTVTPPSEIRLWFTEVPLFESTSIRLLNAADEPLPIEATTRAPDDGRIYFATIGRALPPGVYTVAWRTLASDGHAISEEFSFMVRAADD